MQTILITLSNHRKTESLGTLQVMKGDKAISPVYAVLALPYLDNIKNHSRIPDGIYHAEVLPYSPAFDYPHIWIKGVDGRDGIKIHIANEVEELRGCFAVGTGFNLTTAGVVGSRHALEAILSYIDDEIEVIVTSI